MAKKSSIERNLKRIRLTVQYADKRNALKNKIMDKNISLEERFELQLKLQKLPRNSSRSRIRNRCNVTGHPRGYYRKFGVSRIALRTLGNEGYLPGIIKSSW